jgi:predicted transcriptional regulator YheO
VGKVPECAPFAHSVDELATDLIERAIPSSGVAVELMKKEHKIQVVAFLRKRGFFMIRDAVDMIGDRLGVTRFTIYNYLNELSDKSPS